MGLTFKQELFVDAYLICGNAAEAARRAGYSRKSSRSIGSENLTKPDILTAIRARASEADSTADEVVRRLVEHSRGSMGEFIVVRKDGNADLNLRGVHDKLHMIKKFKKTVKTFTRGEDVETETTYELELYDAQSALVQLGKYHRLWSEKDDEGDLRRALLAMGLNPDDAIERVSDQFDQFIREAAANTAAGSLA